MKSLLPSLWDEKSDPFANLGQDLNRVFADFSKRFPAFGGSGEGTFPALDVNETDRGLEISVEVPGVSEKDIDVSVVGRMLTVKGEKRASKEVSEENRHVSERSYGAFRRTLTLPFEPDPAKVEAHMDNGVLTISLPKPPEEVRKTAKIEVKRKA
ncbi:Hsp20/alpha crystallin family protein [Stappia sp. F7233]|uniref:Hsp20/alpha crystallin family protein n=1 Tax=Stappia albiluteola TaxID=2758565 RepID=A0A839AGS6_9HYPH|nr:Hsp20/alpha crystallin family protein [Stappia albiluteola]MBA5778345.1 Hsp20/alpha crystallin family protein [Stappia albiluteola]